MSIPTVQGYVVVERLGSGSYATVYKAFKKDGPRDVVAIKCVEKTKLSGSAVDSIITEITLLKVLKHDYIVEMKDFLWDDRYIFIIMEFCDGGDLSCFIHKRRKLSENVCKTFLQQLAVALKFLRAHNVCHMDLKPQNLLLVTRPKLMLKVGDFGFAQYLSANDQISSLRGSPLYMAPEILLKHTYDARVDLWSVGVIMYECLFGKAPYSSSNFAELAEKIKTQMPIEIPYNARISVNCLNLLKKLLQHDPEKRIDYDEFFEHPFLDLEHFPTPESYEKAVRLVCEAVEYDKKKEFVQAFSLYSDALRYFIPIVNAEVDTRKRTVLHTKIKSYMARAENLKEYVYTNQTSEKKSLQQKSVSDNFDELCQLCNVTPSLSSALDIGNSAEQYMAEGQYQIALEKFESCLGILVPALGKESKGKRRELLHLQVQRWLKAAEIAKAFVSVETLSDTSIAETKDGCRTQ